MRAVLLNEKPYTLACALTHTVCVITNCLNNSGLLDCHPDVCGVNCGNVHKGVIFLICWLAPRKWKHKCGSYSHRTLAINGSSEAKLIIFSLRAVRNANLFSVNQAKKVPNNNKKKLWLEGNCEGLVTFCFSISTKFRTLQSQNKPWLSQVSELTSRLLCLCSALPSISSAAQRTPHYTVAGIRSAGQGRTGQKSHMHISFKASEP